jgi:hypothetical protein
MMIPPISRQRARLERMGQALHFSTTCVSYALIMIALGVHLSFNRLELLSSLYATSPERFAYKQGTFPKPIRLFAVFDRINPMSLVQSGWSQTDGHF